MYAKEDAGEWRLWRERVAMDRVIDLSADGVLFIILSAECSERPRKDGCRRVAETFGFDNYVLAVVDTFWMLDGWNDSQFGRWSSELAPFSECCGEKRRFLPLFGSNQRIFTGVEVPDDVWDEALALFIEDMH